MHRVTRSLYSLPDAELGEHQSLVEVCRRVPKAVIGLLSALRFHEVGIQLPFEVWIALPDGTQTPAFDYPSLRIARLRGEAYTEGIDTIVEHGSPIRCLSKTVTHCFKFRHKIGLDVAREALNDS